MSVTLYNVVSGDGFIAHLDGSEDFIPNALWDYFISLFKDYDAVAISRKTYEAIQNYEPSELQKFESTPIQKVVVTHDASFSPKERYVVALTPGDAAKFGDRVLVSSGPNLNASFLKSGLVKTIIQYELPVVLGVGIRQFLSVPSMELQDVKEASLGKLKVYRTRPM